MKDRRANPPCELGPTETTEVRERSRVVRFEHFRWLGVDAQSYKEPDGSWQGVARHALVGESGEGTPFHVRYFEIEPQGYTTHERHEHQHVVIPLRGRGEARLGGRWEPVGFGDVVYVAPNDPHQFRAVGDEPFGFLCVVNAMRDRPSASAQPQ